MMDFGFTLSKSSAMDLNKADTSLFERIAETEPDIRKCMACGSCTASCTAGKFAGMSLRKVILALQRGCNKDAARMLGTCMLCGKCSMVCPRGINTRHLILSICRYFPEEDIEK